MIRAVVTAAVLVLAGPALAEVDVKQVDSPGGIHAWLVEEHSIPFVALEIGFRGGTSLDAPDKQGATNLMTGLLEEGAGAWDAQGFAEARDDLAMSVDFDSWDDGVGISARFLTETLDPAGDLLHTVIADPAFEESAIERVRAQVLASIRSDSEDPQALAGEALAAQVYGDHPYGRPGQGDAQTVAGLTRDDIVAAWKGAMAKDRLYVSAVGDITPEQLETLLDKVLGDLPETGAPLPGPAEAALDGQVRVVEYPTPQAVIRFVQPGIDREDPDFFPAYVMTQVLGAGGFESRLMNEIREKRGLTYGVAAYLSSKDGSDLLAGGMATANASVGESIRLVREEWRKMRDAGVTEDELARAKTYLTGAYPLRFDGNGQIASILLSMQMDGMAPDYIDTRNDRVEAVTLQDVQRVAARLLDPDRLSFVVVGQPDGPAE
ncbi:M16 family metallopeptidase [Mangrovicoccus algicola]|uniref:Insulinase family protein n=1 Tax=Mangrovicoccus algicola TaxID=2771008 RepID=A0A8J7D0Y6_9RHOB|nr:pitrilysin family protein [Mangrovicoccus algicola]MBE3640123.1 insulinase family protein [Mangrovicoccus algicola]